MRLWISLSAGLGAAVALAGCSNAARTDPAMTTAAIAGQRACFYAPHVRGFRDGPGGSIVVNTSSRDYFLLQPYHRCGNINVRLNVAVRPRGSNYVCEGYDMDLYVPGPLGAEYCPVRAVRKLSPAEITALRNQKK